MNYSEAIRLAKEGVEEGYTFLYESTYKEKYYLALKYMKNEEAARDVLQDAYMRAFSKLDTLNDPEKFSAWIGMIVANTAKNALVKKNPMLFSDVAVDDEGDSFEYQIEDDNPDIQPETAYTRQETQALVHELLDGLSEEQRMCVLMFHIEGIPIREIAEVLGCSENTVKSRLNYGRKNLKAKAEELQKKGYKLYGITPLPLLLYLLRKDAAYISADKSVASVAEAVKARLLEEVRTGAKTAEKGAETGAGTASNAAHTAAGAAKAGIFHAAAGKTAAIVTGLCVIGGGAFGGYYLMNSQNPAEESTEQSVQEQPSNVDSETDAEQETEVTEVRDEDYPSLIEGNLTKEELEYVLAYGPDKIPQEGFTGVEQSETAITLATLCLGSENSPIEYYGINGNGKYEYSLDDTNRLFSSFSTFRFTEENDSDSEYGIDVDVDGNVLSYIPPTVSLIAEADIISAVCTDEEMEIYYTYECDYADPVSEDIRTIRKAVLRPDENNMYRIVSIEEADGDQGAVQSGADAGQADQEESVQSAASLKELYISVLQSVSARESGYEFSIAGDSAESYGYFLYDMDGDGVKELIIGARFPQQAFYLYDCRVFKVDSNGGKTLEPVGEDFVTMSLYIPSDGNGLYTDALSRGTGQIDISRITISNGGLDSTSECHFIMHDAENQKFTAENRKSDWKDITDFSGLNELS